MTSAPAQAPGAADTERRGGATVEFRNVSKTYAPGSRGPVAVQDLSFIVPAGKICVLVGPSGCGKTTSLKMVNRLIEPTTGQILIDGRDVTKERLTTLRRRIGYVIQQVGLFPHLTVADNVAVVPRLLRWKRGRVRERTDELLNLVGLDPDRYRGRYPSQLSGGERQRVGVARALAADPPVMLMDEPFGAVDPIVRERLQNEFLRLQRELAKTILFVTHDIDEAIKMGDLVAVMEHGGKLAQFGPPDEILARPASDFVARFVGADRGLKRLSLSRVGDLELPRPTLARPGEPAREARQRIRTDPFPYLLLVDREERPIGWIRHQDVPVGGMLDRSMATPSSPLVDRDSTLRDALSVMLASDVQAGIVVDEEGRAQGLVTVALIGAALRGDSARERADGRLGEPEPGPVGQPVGPGLPGEPAQPVESTSWGPTPGRSAPPGPSGEPPAGGEREDREQTAAQDSPDAAGSPSSQPGEATEPREAGERSEPDARAASTERDTTDQPSAPRDPVESTAPVGSGDSSR